MARFETHESMYVESVSNPDGVGVYCRRKNVHPLALIGRYGKACGGLDTLRRNFQLAYDLCVYLCDEGFNILSEGYITESQRWWLEQLAEHHPVHLLCMRVTLEEAIMGIAQRRAARIGDIRPGSREYCEYQLRANERFMRNLVGTKIQGEWVNRQTVEPRLLKLLEVPNS